MFHVEPPESAATRILFAGHRINGHTALSLLPLSRRSDYQPSKTNQSYERTAGKGRRTIPKSNYLTSHTVSLKPPLFLLAVALPIPVRRLFDYLPCPQSPQSEAYAPGQRCLVPFGKKDLVGIIWRAHEYDETPNYKLKPITALLDRQSLIPVANIRIYRWIAQYYHAPLGEIISGSLPPLLRKPLSEQELREKVTTKVWKKTGGTEVLKSEVIRGGKQRALYQLISEHSTGVSHKSILARGFQTTQLRALKDKQLISDHHQLVAPETDQETIEPPELNTEQLLAFHRLTRLANKFTTVLVHGVTGSGKTELYIHWLRHTLACQTESQAQAKQALILVPEIALTPQTVNRFKQFFGRQVMCYHSAMTEKERLRCWLQLWQSQTQQQRHQQEQAQIVIGTRSALLLPFTNLLAIIVDEEHDSSFKQQDGARYHARDLAILRAQQHNCPIILGSATPSFETLYNAEQSRYITLNLRQRHGKQALPEYKVIETGSRPLEGGLSAPAIQAIKTSLSANEQVMVFINRRGYAPVVACLDCGWTAECQSCDVRMTFHLREQRLRCHHCERSAPLPVLCAKCESTNIKPIGTGTERTEQVLSHYFPTNRIVRIDRDSTQSQRAFKELFAAINDGEPCIIVGTQMLAKGHDFPKLNTVVIINADGGLFSSDFRAVEKTAQLIMQVAGRAGRRQQRGRVLLQTQLANHPIIKSLCQHDFLGIYRSEIVLRRQAKLPPVYSMCIIRADAKSMQSGLQQLNLFKEQLFKLALPELRVLGPAPSLLQRKQNRFHCALWLLAPNKNNLRKAINRWLEWRQATNAKENSRVRWLLDVDPAETL